MTHQMLQHMTTLNVKHIAITETVGQQVINLKSMHEDCKRNSLLQKFLYAVHVSEHTYIHKLNRIRTRDPSVTVAKY
jgi:hypothetical protein